MKKIVSLLLVLTVLFCLGAAASAEEWVFDRGVTIVCPWGEGGGPWRAIFAKKGTPQGAVDAMIEAVEVCRGDATWQEFLKEAAYDQREVPFPGEGTQAFCLREYKELRDYLLEQGVLEKDYEDLK